MNNNKISTNSYYSKLAWLMWGLGAAYYAYESLLQISTTPMSAELMQDFSINALEFGIVSGAFFYTYAFMQMPCGILLDFFGPSRLLGYASAILTLGVFLLGNANNYHTAILARLCIGAGAAPAVISCMKIANNWFTADKFAYVLGLTVSVGMTGAIMGTRPIVTLMQYYHWRDIFFYFGIIGAIFTILFLLFCKDSPKNSNDTINKKNSLTELINGLKQAITNSQVWTVAIYGMLMFGPTMTLALWGPRFLQTKCLINNADAHSLILLIFVGWIIGGPFWGYISGKLQKRLPTMRYGTFGALISLCILIYAPITNDLYVGLTIIFVGVTSSGFLNSFSIIRDICSENGSTGVLGFMNTLNSLSPGIMQPITGRLLLMVNDHHTTDYTYLEYQKALTLLPGAVLVALLLLVFIKETNCKNIEH